MTEIELINRFQNLNRAVYKGGDRAPHKPLLLLLLLSKYLHGHAREIHFSEIDSDLTELLRSFGKKTKNDRYNPHNPFFYLRSDGVWDLISNDADTQRELDESNAPRITLFRRDKVFGGLKPDIYQTIIKNRELADRLIGVLLEVFPDSYHQDILDQVGLDDQTVVRKVRKRDPRFREEIIRAYEYQCAICGFSARLNRDFIGVEAAHIKWHQADGPDDIKNGIALCSLHHKLFDRGVFTLDDSFRMLVSEEATGTGLFQHLVTNFHGQVIRQPQRSTYYPDPVFIGWHVREVFREPAKELQ